MCGTAVDGACGCCGATPAAPALSNDPGLPQIAYRSGTHASVLRRMVAALGERLPALAAAAADDPAIGLLDAWATVADVVTFYQERIANEGFLRTATEQRSVLELARAIGYELRPGVSATAFLDIRMQVATGPGANSATAPPTAAVPQGTRVLSIPGQGQVPQTFETSEDLTVAVDSNEIRPRQAEDQVFRAGRTSYYTTGGTTGLRPGDAILVTEQLADPNDVPPSWELRVLSGVAVQPASAPDLPTSTLLTWDDGLASAYKHPEVHALGIQAALFGYNAPDWRSLADAVQQHYPGHEKSTAQWPCFEIGVHDPPFIDLAAAYPTLAAPSLALLVQPGRQRLYRIRNVELSAREDFAISAKTTHVTLDRQRGLNRFGLRETTVYTGARLLPAASEPIRKPTKGPTFDLVVPASLVVGQQVIVTGTAGRADLIEPARVDGVDTPGAATQVTLDHALPAAVDLASLRILGNIAVATNGETVPDEVLGDGDGTASNQRFTLRKPGLTQLPTTAGAGGVTAAVEVRIDGVQWTQVPSLYPAGPHDHVFVVQIDDAGYATLTFGDGEHGSRLPSGQENVRARYRVGVGPDGEVPAHALTLLPARPLGVATVDNPMTATGAAAPEALADARTNAPLTVLTLDRVVSLRDYEDYARAFGGIAKAKAVALQGRTGAFVHLTLAGPSGSPVASDLVSRLLAALDLERDRSATVVAASLDQSLFWAGVAVLADADRVAADVRQAVRQALLDAWSVQNRSFGQPVTAAEILTVAQQVPGVRAALVTELRRPNGVPQVKPVLTAQDAHRDPLPGDPDRVLPAELLLIDPDHLSTTEMSP